MAIQLVRAVDCCPNCQIVTSANDFFPSRADTKGTSFGFQLTVLPVLLHILGVGVSVLLKVFFALSDGVGHLDGLYLVIRYVIIIFLIHLCL